MSKDLFLVRGLPSSGKTTFANKISDIVISADDYFEDSEGNYNFDPNKLGAAHSACKSHVETVMKYSVRDISNIAVANTFTTNKELKPYITLADKYGYTVTTIILESRHGKKNNHNVPDETIEKMRNRFVVVL